MLATVQPRRLWAAERRRTLSRLGIRARLAAAYGRARALRVGSGARRAALYTIDGGLCHFDHVAAPANLVFAGPTREPHVFWPAHRRRHASGMGAWRVPQAGAFRGGWQGLLSNPRSRRPLPKVQAGSTTGGLEIQPAGAFVTCRGSLENPGGFTISVALDLQRMEANPRHKFGVRRTRRRP